MGTLYQRPEIADWPEGGAGAIQQDRSGSELAAGPSDQLLATQVRQSDERAFVTLVRRYDRAIARLAYRVRRLPLFGPNILFRLPACPNLLKPLKSLLHFHNFSRIEPHHHITQLQHPTFS